MPLIECTKCGKRGRVQDPVCWNCRHPRDVVDLAPASPTLHRATAPVSAPAKPAPGAGGDHRHALLFVGVLWFVALWLIFRGASPGQARAQHWAISGALTLMLVAYLAFGWRSKRALVAVAVLGAAGGAALIKPTMYEAGEIFGRMAVAWIVAVAPGLALVLAGLGVGREPAASTGLATPGEPPAPAAP
ncbi:MAG: hypothetical protein ICV87_09115, partial [Gemmatimonadetes bacterium]|nr:hypothetical protein [Gemmatimonadota bacterium]